MSSDKSPNTIASLFSLMGYGPVWVKREKKDSSVDLSSAQDKASPHIQSNESSSAPIIPISVQKTLKPHSATTHSEMSASNSSSEINDILSSSWDELKHKVSACERCHLHKTRTQAVFGVGNPNAKIMLIGEAPGEQEDLKGEPFVGKSGQLLDQMLKALSLDRSIEKGVYIANTLRCRPPENRNPSLDELDTCAPYLTRHIQLIRPQVLLAVGRFAIQWLMKVPELKDSLSSLRGRTHVYEDGDLKIPFIVTYHPSYLLRNPSAKAQAWEDLCLLQRTIENLSNSSKGP